MCLSTTFSSKNPRHLVSARLALVCWRVSTVKSNSKEIDYMSLAERLREARTAAGLSQGQVAKKLGMHRPTVTEIEASRRKVSAEELRQFADLYGVSKDWLVDGADNSQSSDA